MSDASEAANRKLEKQRAVAVGMESSRPTVSAVTALLVDCVDT